ncbi:ABC transporter substrate-binding protein [Bosea massiliensis]|uniref:ABC transporter substrate-binding protein n=1 Tax=Bosea massiliensis TaxID=151419 RepID=A0ABW0P7J2_9HYPH
MPISRRDFLNTGLSAGLASLTLGHGHPALAETPVRGGTLIVAQSSEPTHLNLAVQANNAASLISPKIFDGLLTYEFDFSPKPQLARDWKLSPDGLELVFHLRPNVRWHDSKPFTAADVVFSYDQAWRKFSPRAASLFGSVESVTAPDELTVVWKLSKPAPHLLLAFASHILQIIPRHLYEGTDLLKNAANLKPIGTGPFRFASWERGSHIRLVRNEDYWDQPRPHLDAVIYRFLPDASARAVALETGEAAIVTESGVPGGEIGRLLSLPSIEGTKAGYDYAGLSTYFMFNLDRPIFQDVRVRQAFAHLIDRQFLIEHVWYGNGRPATGPFSSSLQQFYSAQVPHYPLDVEKARQLLDEAGLKPDANGIRLSITHDFVPLGEAYQRTAEYLRDAFAKAGIALRIRSQDMGSYTRRIYTERDFDTANYLLSGGPDPAIGVQRLYWSQGFKVGAPFSNGAHYASKTVDDLLVAAAAEADVARRRKLYLDFQIETQRDLPQIPLVDVEVLTLTQKRLRRHTVSCEGPKGNFAEAFLLPK